MFYALIPNIVALYSMSFSRVLKDSPLPLDGRRNIEEFPRSASEMTPIAI
jgi:hypothetical protein